MSENNKPWFNNRDLYLLIIELQKDMQETRHMIRKYNGLYDKVEAVQDEITDVSTDINEIKSVQKGKKSVGESVRGWSGWIVAIATFIFMLINFYMGG